MWYQPYTIAPKITTVHTFIFTVATRLFCFIHHNYHRPARDTAVDTRQADTGHCVLPGMPHPPPSPLELNLFYKNKNKIPLILSRDVPPIITNLWWSEDDFHITFKSWLKKRSCGTIVLVLHPSLPGLEDSGPQHLQLAPCGHPTH